MLQDARRSSRISPFQVAGDVTGLLLNQILIVRPSQKCDIPHWLLARMTSNNMVSFGIGMVPFAGDVGGAIFKTNSRNALLLEEFLTYVAPQISLPSTAR